MRSASQLLPLIPQNCYCGFYLNGIEWETYEKKEKEATKSKKKRNIALSIVGLKMEVHNHGKSLMVTDY